MRKIVLAVLLLGALGLRAQSFIDNAQINGSFQTDAQYYMLDQGIDITDLNGKKLGINGFGKVGYAYGNFSAGIRFEAFLPEMNGFRNELNGVGLANFFATYDNGFIGITVGDIYDQFGSGLVFRSYEEWSLGMDNALRGVRIILRPTQGVTLKGVYGRQRYYWAPYLERDFSTDDYRGIVRGVDGEWDLNQSISSLNDAKFRMTLGASFVSKKQYDQSLFFYIPENVGAAAGRINLSYGRFAFSTEYAYKINDPSAINNFIYKEGQSLLSSLSYSQTGLGVVLQVKRCRSTLICAFRPETICCFPKPLRNVRLELEWEASGTLPKKIADEPRDPFRGISVNVHIRDLFHLSSSPGHFVRTVRNVRQERGQLILVLHPDRRLVIHGFKVECEAPSLLPALDVVRGGGDRKP